MRWITTGESEKFRGNSNYQSILIRVLGSGGGVRCVCCCYSAIPKREKEESYDERHLRLLYCIVVIIHAHSQAHCSRKPNPSLSLSLAFYFFYNGRSSFCYLVMSAELAFRMDNCVWWCIG